MCYCHDSTSLGGSDYYIQLDSVAIAGTTLNNYTPSNPHIYSSFPASGSTTAHMSQGATYTIAVNSGFMEPAYVGMWIDYDHSGTFDPGEFTTVGTGLYYGTQSVSFTVPLTALTGQTGLRIRNSGFLSSTDACSYEGDGETEDYIISIDTTYPCAGVPVAGTISGPDSVCSAQEFVLTASGYTIATGLTFQWLSMPAGAGSFTAIPGATSATLVVYGQPVATDYEFEVTCSGSAISVYTVKYTASELPFTRCYCDSASLGGTTYYAPIDSVGIVGTTLTNNTPFNPNTYSVYPASGTTTATLQQGTYYTIAVKSTTGGDAASSYVWVDYNHDGVYDAGEATLVGSSVLGVASAELYIPATALTGQTGLRVRTVDPMDDFIGAGDACTDLFSGETEDYLITIDTTYPCTGTPLAGSVSGPSGICPSSAFNLMLAGYTNGTGITIAWQQSPAGAGSFTTIPGATAPIYASTGITTATDYRVVVTCSGSGLSATTATVTVSVNPFINCYCSPATGTTLVYGGQTEVLKGTIAGTTFNSTAFTVSYATGYEQVSPALLQNTAVLHLGHTYAYTLIMDTALYYPSAAGVWIDYDHNGVFESSEYTGFGSDLYGGTYTGDVTVPAGSLTGQTGMRIAASDEYIDPSIACNTIYYGEIADFIITIEAGGTYVAPVANADFTVRAFPNPAGRSVTISTTGTPGDNRTILLTDVTGRIVTKVTAVGNKTELDLEGLATGMYLVKYEDDQHVAVIKINKQ